ncbi:MAG: extracellular solute-binding protein [Butyrivibrio sp.]|nr:extracellular solute-binding protein [Butyrivibrio sp.]
MNLLNLRRLISSLLITSCTTLLFTGCGKSGTSGTETSQDKVAEYGYLSEYLESDFSDDSENNYDNFIFKDDNIYCTNTTYSSDEESEDTGTNYTYIKLNSDGTGLENLFTLKGKYEESGPGNFLSDYYNYLAVDKDNNIIVSKNSYSASTDEYFLEKYDQSGTLLAQADVTNDISSAEYSAYISSIASDGEGNIYVSSSSKIIQYKSDLTYNKEIALSDGASSIRLIPSSDGKIYAYYWTENGQKIDLLDASSSTVSQSYSNIPTGDDFYIFDENTIYISDTDVNKYDLSTQTYEKVLSWMDCDLSYDYVRAFKLDEDGNLDVVYKDFDVSETSVVHVKKVPYSEIENRQEITLGMINQNYYISSAALKFNKTHPEYHVNIKTYYDNSAISDDYEEVWNNSVMSFSNDLTSNSGTPDVILLNDVNKKSLQEKKVFEDLTPFIENSSEISMDDIQKAAIECGTVNGQLIGLPKSIIVRTILAASSQVGDKMGWTFDDFYKFVEANPDVNVFSDSTKQGMLNTLCIYNIDSFINYQTGQCSFNSDSFIKLLEYSNTFIDQSQYNWDNDTDSEPVKIQKHEQLLSTTYLYELDSIQEHQGYFGEPTTFIGYPCDDGIGNYVEADGILGINSASKNKDVAWKFIEYYLTYEDDQMSTTIPTLKSQLNKIVEEARTVKYQTDVDGNYVLDENGEKIPVDSERTISYGDWEYKYHTITDEEIQTLQELLDSCRTKSDYDQQIINIISEETEAFFAGQKTAAEVADIIQSRVKIYVNENL